MIPWTILMVVALIIVLGIVAAIMAYKSKDKRKGPDYYTYFLIGMVWMAFGIYGIITDGTSIFFFLGIIFLAVGLRHKKEWKTNHVPFSKLPEAKKRMTLIMMGLLTMAVLVWLVTYMMLR